MFSIKLILLETTGAVTNRGIPENGAICVSAVTGDGIDALSNALDRKFGALRQVVIYDIPSTDGSAALAWLYKNGDVISSEPQDMSSIVKVALQVPDVGRFARRFSLEPL